MKVLYVIVVILFFVLGFMIGKANCNSNIKKEPEVLTKKEPKVLTKMEILYQQKTLRLTDSNKQEYDAVQWNGNSFRLFPVE